jgi:hypothetical protein
MLGVVLAIAGCRRPSEEERAKTALEGRNPRGSSPYSQDDRIPEVTGEAVGSQPGYVEGAFAYASCNVQGLRTLWPWLPIPSEWAGLVKLLDGVDPSARISASARMIASGMHVRVELPEAECERIAAVLRELIPSGVVLMHPRVLGCGLDLFFNGETERERIAQSVALPGGKPLPELEDLRGDAVVLIDGPTTLAAVGVDPSLRETERLFAGMTFELALAESRLLARGRWLTTESGRERLQSVFELDPVDADVPSIAALCEGSLLCARSRGLPSRERFASLATGIYADPDALTNRLDEPEVVLALLLETWPNAIASLLAPRPDTLSQNAAELGARVLGFGLAVRSRDAIDEHWIAYARTSAADVETIRLLEQLAPATALPGSFHAVFDPGNAWGFAVLTDDEVQVPWLTELDHDDGAVPLVYVEVSDVAQLGIANTLAGHKLRTQLSLTPGWAPELRVQLDR